MDGIPVPEPKFSFLAVAKFIVAILIGGSVSLVALLFMNPSESWTLSEVTDFSLKTTDCNVQIQQADLGDSPAKVTLYRTAMSDLTNDLARTFSSSGDQTILEVKSSSGSEWLYCDVIVEVNLDSDLHFTSLSVDSLNTRLRRLFVQTPVKVSGELKVAASIAQVHFSMTPQAGSVDLNVNEGSLVMPMATPTETFVEHSLEAVNSAIMLTSDTDCDVNMVLPKNTSDDLFLAAGYIEQTSAASDNDTLTLRAAHLYNAPGGANSVRSLTARTDGSPLYVFVESDWQWEGSPKDYILSSKNMSAFVGDNHRRAIISPADFASDKLAEFAAWTEDQAVTQQWVQDVSVWGPAFPSGAFRILSSNVLKAFSTTIWAVISANVQGAPLHKFTVPTFGPGIFVGRLIDSSSTLTYSSFSDSEGLMTAQQVLEASSDAFARLVARRDLGLETLEEGNRKEVLAAIAPFLPPSDKKVVTYIQFHGDGNVEYEVSSDNEEVRAEDIPIVGLDAGPSANYTIFAAWLAQMLIATLLASAFTYLFFSRTLVGFVNKRNLALENNVTTLSVPELQPLDEAKEPLVAVCKPSYGGRGEVTLRWSQFPSLAQMKSRERASVVYCCKVRATSFSNPSQRREAERFNEVCHQMWQQWTFTERDTKRQNGQSVYSFKWAEKGLFEGVVYSFKVNVSRNKGLGTTFWSNEQLITSVSASDIPLVCLSTMLEGRPIQSPFGVFSVWHLNPVPTLSRGIDGKGVVQPDMDEGGYGNLMFRNMRLYRLGNLLKNWGPLGGKIVLKAYLMSPEFMENWPEALKETDQSENLLFTSDALDFRRNEYKPLNDASLLETDVVYTLTREPKKKKISELNDKELAELKKTCQKEAVFIEDPGSMGLPQWKKLHKAIFGDAGPKKAAHTNIRVTFSDSKGHKKSEETWENAQVWDSESRTLLFVLVGVEDDLLIGGASVPLKSLQADIRRTWRKNELDPDYKLPQGGQQDEYHVCHEYLSVFGVNGQILGDLQFRASMNSEFSVFPDIARGSAVCLGESLNCGVDIPASVPELRVVIGDQHYGVMNVEALPDVEDSGEGSESTKHKKYFLWEVPKLVKEEDQETSRKRNENGGKMRKMGHAEEIVRMIQTRPRQAYIELRLPDSASSKSQRRRGGGTYKLLRSATFVLRDSPLTFEVSMAYASWCQYQRLPMDDMSAEWYRERNVEIEKKKLALFENMYDHRLTFQSKKLCSVAEAEKHCESTHDDLEDTHTLVGDEAERLQHDAHAAVIKCSGALLRDVEPLWDHLGQELVVAEMKVVQNLALKRRRRFHLDFSLYHGVNVYGILMEAIGGGITNIFLARCAQLCCEVCVMLGQVLFLLFPAFIVTAVIVATDWMEFVYRPFSTSFPARWTYFGLGAMNAKGTECPPTWDSTAGSKAIAHWAACGYGDPTPVVGLWAVVLFLVFIGYGVLIVFSTIYFNFFSLRNLSVSLRRNRKEVKQISKAISSGHDVDLNTSEARSYYRGLCGRCDRVLSIVTWCCWGTMVWACAFYVFSILIWVLLAALINPEQLAPLAAMIVAILAVPSWVMSKLHEAAGQVLKIVQSLVDTAVALVLQFLKLDDMQQETDKAELQLRKLQGAFEKLEDAVFSEMEDIGMVVEEAAGQLAAAVSSEGERESPSHSASAAAATGNGTRSAGPPAGPPRPVVIPVAEDDDLSGAVDDLLIETDLQASKAKKSKSGSGGNSKGGAETETKMVEMLKKMIKDAAAKGVSEGLMKENGQPYPDFVNKQLDKLLDIFIYLLLRYANGPFEDIVARFTSFVDGDSEKLDDLKSKVKVFKERLGIAWTNTIRDKIEEMKENAEGFLQTGEMATSLGLWAVDEVEHVMERFWARVDSRVSSMLTTEMDMLTAKREFGRAFLPVVYADCGVEVAEEMLEASLDSLARRRLFFVDQTKLETLKHYLSKYVDYNPDQTRLENVCVDLLKTYLPIGLWNPSILTGRLRMTEEFAQGAAEEMAE
uniref:Uncharacterized protein n=1 Tax=Chromera velia CCMP2878 TaxID=1169474 RepID=A0A0G4F6L6_9ALVE|eukprot:Cvel_2788.t1-p1 / transcript=Cvel_2788.t1 / gene=Cvel_2788 / organism=Chromera_velia_CCMP2878 / gene_product=hypothetical protein / transcript_product=hypothetical protein / location=Cvel_scaffold112:85273-97316(-) / protein_length=1989 / sequence_SO=supercontig / SO=protein_coding / is_pseudo=false